MKRLRTLLLGFALAAAGCGGGSGTSGAPAAANLPAPVPTVPAPLPASAAPAPPASANASATITVVYPPGFHQAKAPAGTHRSPGYVNPSTGYLLHVKVGGTDVAGSPFTVNFSGGTQTIHAPVTANASAQTLTIEERDSADALILAQGTTSFTIASPGGSASPTVTLSINAQRVAITTDNSAGSDAQALGNGLPNPTPFCTGNATLYPFAADLSNGFVLPGVNAGNVAGVPVPALISQTPDGGTSALGGPTGNAYPIVYDGAGTGLTAVFGVANPLAALGVTFPNGAYPGQWIGSAYIYKNCTPTLSTGVGTIVYNGSTSVTIAGGAPPFTYNVTTPSVCSVTAGGSRTGTLTGSGTVAGNCNFSVTDNAGNTSSGATVAVQNAPLTVACAGSACTGIANGPSAYTLNISEPTYGTGTYTLSLSGSHCFATPSTSVTASSGSAIIYVTGNPLGGNCFLQVSDSLSQLQTATMQFVAAGNPVAGGIAYGSAPSPPGGNTKVDGGAGCPPTCSSSPYPNIQWGGYTYYPWSYSDNRFAFGVAAYDGRGSYVGIVQASGDRYIGSVTVNVGPQTVTLFGQGGSATMDWSASSPSLLDPLLP